MDGPVDYLPKSSSVVLDDVDDDVEPQLVVGICFNLRFYIIVNVIQEHTGRLLVLTCSGAQRP